MLGVFCWPRATKVGAIAGLVAGVGVVFLFNVVWPNPLNVHAGIWGLLVNIPVFIIASLLTKPSKKETLARFFPAYIMDQLYVPKAELNKA
jgi:SSS family solute:Na+ symporter